MSEVPVYFSAGDDNEYWTGIPRERALEWTRVFLRRFPSVPGTIIWRVKPNLAKGIPAGFTDWAHRAQVAEAIGFSPERYEALHAALDALDPERFPNHPDNHLITRGLRPVRPFDVERWTSWNRRVDYGSDALTVTADQLMAPVHGPYELSSGSFAAQDDEFRD